MSRARQIQQGTRKGQKARVALCGPAGSGKTWTGLLLATELAGSEGKILVVDTERGSAGLYADHFRFETIDWLPPYDPRELAEDIGKLSKEYDVIHVDSLTHFWQGEGGTLDIVDGAGARAQGNKFAGWKTGTPAQNGLVEALLAADAHIIVTMRSKTEYVQEKDKSGRTTIRKVGMAPIQRDGIEFEFTVTADLDQEHRLLVTKSRCHPVADQMYQGHQAKAMAQTLLEWLNSAEPEVSPSAGSPSSESAARVDPALGDSPGLPAFLSNDDWTVMAIREGIDKLEPTYKSQLAEQWSYGSVKKGSTTLLESHADAAQKLVLEFRDKQTKAYTARNIKALDAMKAVGITSEHARHECVSDATAGITESTKQLTQEQLSAIEAKCKQLADSDTGGESP